ncbi:MAG: hypothetical protein ACKO3G_16230 [Planctomycetaceae bacterium]
MSMHHLDAGNPAEIARRGAHARHAHRVGIVDEGPNDLTGTPMIELELVLGHETP